MGKGRFAVKELSAQRMNRDWLKTVDINVPGGTASASSSADPELVGGLILGIYPTGNQDQILKSVALNANGSITITLAANATGVNNFRVVTMKRATFGTT